MIKKIACLFVFVATLSGCSTVYKYQGQTYDSKEKFHSAVDNHISSVLTTITPLPTPLTQKKLMFAIPSALAYHEHSVQNFIKAQGSEPTAAQREVALNLTVGNFKSIKGFFDAVKKRNIYTSTQYIEMDSTSGSFAASSDSDVLFLIEPTANSSQWFYISDKHGKQIFAYDRSSPTAEGKVLAFVEAVQAQAIRD